MHNTLVIVALLPKYLLFCVGDFITTGRDREAATPLTPNWLG